MRLWGERVWRCPRRIEGWEWVKRLGGCIYDMIDSLHAEASGRKCRLYNAESRFICIYSNNCKLFNR